MLVSSIHRRTIGNFRQLNKSLLNSTRRYSPEIVASPFVFNPFGLISNNLRSTIELSKSKLQQSIQRFKLSEINLGIFDSLWLCSTKRKRKIKMNKHKRRKARKLMRKNTKLSRQI